MRLFIVIAVTLVAAGGQSAYGLDFSKVTCHAFLASGRDNMAAMIMWLRGYHAGRNGSIAYNSADPYAKTLGRFCRDHPLANLIDASERILRDEDRGI
jgi:hypothetical protein